MRAIRFHPVALVQYNEWVARDIKIFNRIRELIKAIQDNPFKGIGKPESLKYQFKGCWSRRITDAHRLIYKIANEEIFIISCKGHYD